MAAFIHSTRATIIFAFAAVYLIWGSTYLAIRIAIETIPPLMMLGFRFGLAGLTLYAWLRWRGAPRPPFVQWRAATAVGGLMLCLGTGAVALGEQYISSGLAALIVTTVPLWMVLLEWARTRIRPGNAVFMGLLLGFTGVTVLFDPFGAADRSQFELLGVLIILGGSLSWSIGSVFSRGASLPASPAMATALEMLMGGACLMVLGLASGEGARFDVAAISLNSFLAWTYLLVFGSFIGFGAYVWLLRNTTATRVSTYAFVNPAVAVLLGCWLGGEPFSFAMGAGMLLLVSAVVLVILKPKPSLQFSAAKKEPCPDCS